MSVMKKIFTMLVLMLPVVVWGQAGKGIRTPSGNVVDTARIDMNLRVKGSVRMDQYATGDSTKFFSVDASGNLVLRTVAGGGGGGSYTAGRGLGLAGSAFYLDTTIGATQTDLNAYQPLLGYVAENVARKVTSLGSPNDSTYPTTAAVNSALGDVYDAIGDSAARARHQLDSVGELLTGYVSTGHTITVNGDEQDMSNNNTFTVTDANISISDVTTNNATSLKHGWLPKLSGSATQYLDGNGGWSAPVGTTYTGSAGVALAGTNFTLDYSYAGTFTNAIWQGVSIGTAYTDAKVVSVAGSSGRISSTGGANPVLDLVTVNAAPATSGSATIIPVLTYDAWGRVTGVTTATATPAVSSITGLGSGVGTWLATPSSANLASALTDETGTGVAVFANSPALAGTPTAPTASASDSSTTIATTAYVDAVRQIVTTTNFTTSYTINSTDKRNIEITITAQAGALLWNNPTGTWVHGQMGLVSVYDDGTGRAQTFGSKFAGMNGSSLPTTTVTGRPLVFIIRYNKFLDKFFVSVPQ